ncbi:MAG: outer membrane beta-barrel family protein [Flavisolibacter sp.]
MKKFCFFLLVLSMAGFGATAQKVAGTVKGILQDSISATLISDATVSVVRTRDSSLISFSLTSRNGAFEIKNLDAGEYHLISSFQGLQTRKTKFVISQQSPVADLGLIKLDRFYKELEGVVVTDEAPVRIKGDTLAFNADAFKTKPNATAEDLLKKLPGVQVDRDGTVKAQGENVQKVYVDGKEFFGNDPKLATKNLAAEMIDQVEIFDDMSEQAKFNGVDDGSRSKAINLKLKKEKKKGVFGKAYAGYGTNERYDAGLTANLFKGAMQTSLIAKSNNTNNIGYTVNDMLGMFGGGGGMIGGRSGGMNLVRVGGSGGGNFGGLNLGSAGSGLTSSTQLGLNYRDTWSPSFDLSGSYFYNRTQTRNNQSSLRQTFVNDTTYINDQLRQSLSRNDNHRMNLHMTWRVDSLNSIIYSPSISYQNSLNESDDTTSFFSQVLQSKEELNQSRQFINGTGEGLNWTNNLVWRKKFSRTGRTLSVTLNNTLNNSLRENYNVFNAKFNPRNNYNNTDGNTRNYGAGFSYTEPLSRNKVMEFNYNYSRNKSESDRESFAYNNTTGKYDQPDMLQTNHFQNINESHRGGANFRVVQKKYNYQLGVSVQHTNLVSDNLTKNTLEDQQFLNFFPTASFNYQFQRSRSLRFNYRGSTRQPSINQLQDILDISNAPYYYIGNAGLKPEFTNNIMLSYNFFDMVKFRNLFAYITYNNTYNRIANSVTINADGTQLTRPVNMNGYYMLSGNFNVGFPIKKMKGGNFNTTTRAMVNREPGLFNGVKNFTNNINIGEDLRLNYNYKEKLDLGITASINYNSIKYSNPGSFNQDQSYFTHSYSADVSYTLPKNFILATDFDYTFNTGRTAGYNQNFALWNASLAKLVFKNKRGEIKASVFDIMNQNISITRNIGANYVEDVRNMTLQRYFMLTFTYNINRMGGKSMPAMLERATRGVRIMQ